MGWGETSVAWDNMGDCGSAENSHSNFCNNNDSFPLSHSHSHSNFCNSHSNYCNSPIAVAVVVVVGSLPRQSASYLREDPVLAESVEQVALLHELHLHAEGVHRLARAEDLHDGHGLGQRLVDAHGVAAVEGAAGGGVGASAGGAEAPELCGGGKGRDKGVQRERARDSALQQCMWKKERDE